MVTPKGVVVTPKGVVFRPKSLKTIPFGVTTTQCMNPFISVKKVISQIENHSSSYIYGANYMQSIGSRSRGAMAPLKF